MVAARPEEQCGRIVPHRSIEPESLGEEGGGSREVPHVQVDVTDGRAGRHPVPRDTARSLEQPGDIHRIGSHHQLASDPPPGATRPVGADLDAKIVGVLQVERFADEVVAGTGAGPDVPEVGDEATE